MRLFILVIAIYLVIALAFPLYVMFSKSLENSQGAFVGFQNYLEYFNTPALVYSIQNSLFIGVVTTTITVTIAFILAYALTRSRMPGKPVFKTIAMIPIPPSHCKIARHSKMPGGRWSRPVSTVDPVVVMPDMLSNTASVRLMPRPRNGIAATAATVTHPNTVTRKAWRRFRVIPSLGQAAMAAPKPMNLEHRPDQPI